MEAIYLFIIILSIDSGLDSIYYNFECIPQESLNWFEDSAIFPIKDKEQQTESQSLKVSGVKNFNFDIDRGFEQGMKIAITGELEGIKIEGNLSDQGAPSQTRRISDIEKMNLNCSTKNFYGGVGNLSLNLPFGVSDEIEGGRVGIFTQDKEAELNLSYALNRGEYRKIEIEGEEGKQGPYFLNESVVYASEKVYLTQGIYPPKILRRDDDYYLDYPQGILTFTNKNIITSTTRITIEYQKSAQDYLTTYQEFDAQLKSRDFTLITFARRINDDKDSPLLFTFSPSETTLLKSSGDSVRVYHIYADTSSMGNYIIEDSHFVYVGEGNGQYNVTFFYTGENKGEYIYDPNIKGFLYVGEKMGNYSPARAIIPPRDNQFYGLGITHQYGEVNLFTSQLDQNTYSKIDDQDNRAFGYKFNSQRKFHLLSYNLDYINYQNNLALPFAREDVTYYYIWNTGDPLKEMANLELSIVPTSFLKIDFGSGILNRNHYRQVVKLRPFFFYLGYEKIDVTRKLRAGFSKEINRLSLLADWVRSISTEEKNWESNQLNYEGRYKVNNFTSFGISGEYYREAIRGITTKVDFSSLPLKIFFGHRSYGDTTLLFGNLETNLSYKNLMARGSIQQSQRYSQKRDEYFQRVKDGTGDYVYDSVTNTYIQKVPGDYIKKTILLRDFQRVIVRNYSLETGYRKDFFETNGRFSYINETNFFSHLEELRFNFKKEETDFEMNLQQDFSEDSRYALESILKIVRRGSISPSYKKFYNLNSITETIEKVGQILREEENDYSTEFCLEIIEEPQVKPSIGYTYSRIFSGYFEDLILYRQTPKFTWNFARSIKRKGRVELSGEFIYRKYNIADVPFFFSANAPPGLTKTFGLNFNLGIGDNTGLSLIYTIQFPAGQKFNQNLKFQTRIRF
uniref:Uncharacterized protein n=1 Tax=candidate division WOR-3 bacterium TaxID=2052148 RepID=A0A7C4TB19_UNCW3